MLLYSFFLRNPRRRWFNWLEIRRCCWWYKIIVLKFEPRRNRGILGIGLLNWRKKRVFLRLKWMYYCICRRINEWHDIEVIWNFKSPIEFFFRLIQPIIIHGRQFLIVDIFDPCKKCLFFLPKPVSSEDFLDLNRSFVLLSLIEDWAKVDDLSNFVSSKMLLDIDCIFSSRCIKSSSQMSLIDCSKC